MIQSQPTAIVPVPLQGFAHPKKRYLEDGQARYSKVWVLVKKKKKKKKYIYTDDLKLSVLSGRELRH